MQHSSQRVLLPVVGGAGKFALQDDHSSTIIHHFIAPLPQSAATSALSPLKGSRKGPNDKINPWEVYDSGTQASVAAASARPGQRRLNRQQGSLRLKLGGPGIGIANSTNVAADVIGAEEDVPSPLPFFVYPSFQLDAKKYSPSSVLVAGQGAADADAATPLQLVIPLAPATTHRGSS